MKSTVACILLLAALLVATQFTILFANASVGDFWVAKAPLPSFSDEFFNSVAVNGKVYVVATNISAGGDSNPSYMYDPAANTWTQKAPMPYFQEDFGLTTYQGRIYVIGGSFYSLPTATIQVYNPATDSWSNSTDLQLPVAQAVVSAVTVNGKIYVMGGAFIGMAVPIPYGINEVYDPNSNTWSKLADMPNPVVGFAMTAVGNKIYLVGGESDEVFSNNTQIFDIQTNTWSLGSTMPAPPGFNGAVAATTGVFAPKRIYYLADSTQIYDPQTDKWSIGATEPNRYVASLAVVNDTIYALGGFDENSNTTSNEQYFPAAYTGPEPAISPTPSIPEVAIFPLIACLSATLFGAVFLKRHSAKC